MMMSGDRRGALRSAEVTFRPTEAWRLAVGSYLSVRKEIVRSSCSMQ
jgi:hypothetical protein